jgi:hypothetical protein
MTRYTGIRAILVVCAVGGVAHAAPGSINLIQQVHTVWGDAGDPVTSTYFVSGAGLVTGSASAGVSPADWGVATSTAGPEGLFAFRDGQAGWANAYAQSMYTFRPVYSILVLDVAGVIGEWAFENLARVGLTDLTTSTLVYSFTSPHQLDELDDETIGGFAFAFQHSLPVNPAHMYELMMWVEAHRGEGGSGSAEMRIEFYSIPLPSAILLGCLGTTLVGHLRRRGML